MMERPVRQVLKGKILEAENALEVSLVEGATGVDLKQHDESLQSLDRLLQRFPAKKGPAWLLPLFIALVAGLLLSIAAAIRLPGPYITVDARLSALTITAASDGTGLSTSTGLAGDTAIPVKSLEVVGDATAPSIASKAVSISSLKLMAGTTARFGQRASCFEVQIPIKQGATKTGLALGLQLLVMHPPKTQGQLSTPMELQVSPGATVTICSDLPATYAFAGKVERIDLFRSLPGDVQQGFEDVRTPSIVSGKLRLQNINRIQDLQDTDMLSFDGIERGWAFVFPAPAMRVIFSGTVTRPVSVSPTLEGGTASLEPTLLEWFSKSPLVTAVFGLVTGFVGMLWGLAKYFGFFAR